MKAKARQIAGLIPQDMIDIASREGDQWTAKRVLMALFDAYLMQNQIGGRVGHRPIRSGMPDFLRDKNKGDYPDPRSKAATVYKTAMTPTRMEMVLYGFKDREGQSHSGWMRYLWSIDLDIWKPVDMWIIAKLRRQPVKQACVEWRIEYTTFLSRRDRGAALIAQWLNAHGVAVF